MTSLVFLLDLHYFAEEVVRGDDMNEEKSNIRRIIYINMIFQVKWNVSHCISIPEFSLYHKNLLEPALTSHSSENRISCVRKGKV